MKNILLTAVILFPSFSASAQTDNPFIKLVNPLKEKSSVNSSKQFIIGSTCKTCTVKINNIPAKVYSTGAIAFPVSLLPGDSSFSITATNPAGKSNTKTISFSYAIPKVAEPVKTLGIESIQTFPEGNLVLLPGDKIQFKIKPSRAQISAPSTVRCCMNYPLHRRRECPASTGENTPLKSRIIFPR